MAFKEGISILFGALHGDSPPPHLLLVPGVLFEAGEGSATPKPSEPEAHARRSKNTLYPPTPFPEPSFPDFRPATPNMSWKLELIWALQKIYFK